jgi:hypothetical protein
VQDLKPRPYRLAQRLDESCWIDNHRRKQFSGLGSATIPDNSGVALCDEEIPDRT